MNDLLRVTVFVIGALFGVLNFYLLMKKKVTERASIVWMIGVLLAFVTAAFPQEFNEIARHLGVDYPPALLYLVAILALLTTVMYQSMQIAMFDQKLREVAQTLAIIEHGLGRQAAATKRLEDVPSQIKGVT